MGISQELSDWTRPLLSTTGGQIVIWSPSACWFTLHQRAGRVLAWRNIFGSYLPSEMSCIARGHIWNHLPGR